METDRNRVIAAEGACDCHSVHLTRVHHHDFPDIHAEGETPVIAAASRESAERTLDNMMILTRSHDYYSDN